MTHEVDIPLATLLGDWLPRAEQARNQWLTRGQVAAGDFVALVEELLTADNGSAAP